MNARWTLLAAVAALSGAGCAGSRAEPPPEPVAGQVVFVVEVPGSTPTTDAVYLAGDFQGWRPGVDDWRLRPLGEKRHAIAFRPPGHPIEFKFTRGPWSKVEKGVVGEEIANRALAPVPGETYRFTVANWADLGPAAPARPSTVTGELRIRRFDRFLDGRTVRVWVPPGYEEGRARYPVVYVWDGQNLFDDATSFAGEWHIDEACTELIAAGVVAPLIVVGIDNGGQRRGHEYGPWTGGVDHLDAVIEHLKPIIDREYRTRPGRASTGIAGSSLGGLMTIYAAYARPDVFALAGSFSPVLEWDGHDVASWVSGRAKPDSRLYADMGGLEAGRFIDGDGNGVADSLDRLRNLEAAAVGQGFVAGEDLMIVPDPGGKHHESAWARRFREAIVFLFPAD